jgi:hypothetical protein
MPREAAADTLTAPPETPAVETTQDPTPEAPQETPTETPAESPEAQEEPSFGDSKDKDLQAAFEAIDEQPTPEAPKEEAADDAAEEEGEPAETPLEDDPRQGPKQLRDRVKEQNKQLAEYQKRERDLNAKLKMQQESGESPALVEAVKQQEEVIEKLKGELAGLRFQESEEFVNKYQKPWEKAAGKARTLIEDLEVIEEDDSGMQSTRPANWKTDFFDLWNMKVGQRLSVANQRFGAAAPMVLARLEQLQQMNQDMVEARTEEEAAWQQKGKEREAQQAIAKAEASKLWEKANEDVASKHGDWYASEEEPEVKAVENKARDLADYYFNTRFDTLSTEDQIMLEAQMKQRFIALPVIARKLKEAQQKNDQLYNQIAELTGSDPRGETRRGQAAPKAPDPDSPENLKKMLEDAFD